MKIGITGHQNLGDSKQVYKIKELIKKIISEEKASYGFTSLAKGADQLFAEVLIELKIPYCAVIPSNDYEATFDKDSLKKYENFVEKSIEKKKLYFDKPEEKAFYDAGKYVVDNSDILIAVWDGQLAKGLGGTGDIVDYCLHKNKTVIHIHPVTLLIKHL